MLPPLKKVLETAGLSPKQILVLSALLESGSPVLAAAVARTTKLNRTTVYDLLKELVALGLASQAKKGGVMRYQSIALELMPSYLERRREVLEESKKQLHELIPQLKLLRARGKSLPKVQFFEGLEGLKQAYEDTIENNTEKFLRGITDMDRVYHGLDQYWVEYYLKKRTERGVRCVDLVPEGEAGRRSKGDDTKYIRTTKFLPPNFDLGGDVNIFDNKVTMISYAPENPMAVVIEDPVISNMMKKLFDFMEQHCKE